MEKEEQQMLSVMQLLHNPVSSHRGWPLQYIPVDKYASYRRYPGYDFQQ
jgi:hypothetical protein